MDKEKLREAGILYDDGLRRFSGYKDLYEKHLGKFPLNPVFAELKEAMDQGDYNAAFAAAHTLKGLSGNLSLQGLYRSLKDFVEFLRGGSDIPAALRLYPGVLEEYELAVDVIREQFP